MLQARNFNAEKDGPSDQKDKSSEVKLQNVFLPLCTDSYWRVTYRRVV